MLSYRLLLAYAYHAIHTRAADTLQARAEQAVRSTLGGTSAGGSGGLGACPATPLGFGFTSAGDEAPRAERLTVATPEPEDQQHGSGGGGGGSAGAAADTTPFYTPLPREKTAGGLVGQQEVPAE
jgi:hypothetical protein